MRVSSNLGLAPIEAHLGVERENLTVIETSDGKARSRAEVTVANTDHVPGRNGGIKEVNNLRHRMKCCHAVLATERRWDGAIGPSIEIAAADRQEELAIVGR